MQSFSDIHLLVSGHIRLVSNDGRINSKHGTIQIYHNRQWYTIRYYNIGYHTNFISIACRMMGRSGEGQLLWGSHFGNIVGPYNYDIFKCKSDDLPTIFQCDDFSFSKWFEDDDHDDASLICL